jgi:pimeloyl-ACP methyl ester carboxylesterase
MRVENGGVELSVELQGATDAPLIVFLHGVSGCCRTYDFLPPKITDGRRIARVDLRGHGQSHHAPGTYTIDHYGEDVVAVLRALDRPAVLVGHSLGGVTAWWVAQHAPELVAAALLEDPPLYMGEPAEHDKNLAIPVFRSVRERAIAWQRDGATIDDVAAALVPAPLGPVRTMGDVMQPDALRARAEAYLLMDPGVLEQAADRSTLAPTDTTAPVAVPVLVLGADDTMGSAFPARHEQRLAASHPDVEVTRVAGAGHGIHEERAHRADYVDRVAAFLDRTATSA